ncbi:hypothetical protein NC651_036640 [Populus alba x Populus x berolinensis]|nr:hypothetical protein NC651_036637 [Populus alba x Populus x berolinensis]KAJ6860333.1 hypothetical protein NC651_036639 [Populus alba x Populus x berolinensis]KAJ6860334.1 hypothetical protein NC651_036640 [Populus alba x Populus x berolinensis]
MIQLLSSWVPHFSYKNCVLSLPPDTPECAVMFFYYDYGIHRNHVFAIVVGWLNKQSRRFSLMLYANGFPGQLTKQEFCRTYNILSWVSF